MTFQTTAAYVSGGVCGKLWWPVGAMAGKPLNADLRREFGRLTGIDHVSFRDVLDSILTENGGDFCGGASFTADSIIRIERRSVDGAGRYRVHVREREISELADCADLVEPDSFVSDFMGDE